jgi:hypothetical protein
MSEYLFENFTTLKNKLDCVEYPQYHNFNVEVIRNISAEVKTIIRDALNFILPNVLIEMILEYLKLVNTINVVKFILNEDPIFMRCEKYRRGYQPLDIMLKPYLISIGAETISAKILNMKYLIDGRMEFMFECGFGPNFMSRSICITNVYEERYFYKQFKYKIKENKWISTRESIEISNDIDNFDFVSLSEYNAFSKRKISKQNLELKKIFIDNKGKRDVKATFKNYDIIKDQTLIERVLILFRTNKETKKKKIYKVIYFKDIDEKDYFMNDYYDMCTFTNFVINSLVSPVK